MATPRNGKKQRNRITGLTLLTSKPKAKSTIGVLLIHGLTGMPNEMRPVAHALEEMGCQVEVPLLPGHGGGHAELLASNWLDWVKACQESLDRLSLTCEHVVVGGLSMGALIAVLLAATNENVDGVLCLSPTIAYDSINSSNPFQKLLPLIDLLPLLGKFFYWTEKPPYGLKDERLQRIITKQLEKVRRGEKTDFGQFRTYAGSLRQLQRLVAQVKLKAADVTCPTLIIHSLEDTLTKPHNAKTLKQWLGTKDKSIIWMDGCDHVLTLDLKKDEVARLCVEFVEKVTKSKGRAKLTAVK
jgi:carboxylesterase